MEQQKRAVQELPKLSTTELQGLVAFALASGELVAGLLNGLDLTDLAKAVKVAKLAPGLTHFKAALCQYQAMTDDEALELEQFVVDNFHVNDAAIESVVTTALGAVIKLHDLSRLFLPGHLCPVPAAAPSEDQAVS